MSIVQQMQTTIDKTDLENESETQHNEEIESIVTNSQQSDTHHS